MHHVGTGFIITWGLLTWGPFAGTLFGTWGPHLFPHVWTQCRITCGLTLFTGNNAHINRICRARVDFGSSSGPHVSFRTIRMDQLRGRAARLFWCLYPIPASFPLKTPSYRIPAETDILTILSILSTCTGNSLCYSLKPSICTCSALLG